MSDIGINSIKFTRAEANLFLDEQINALNKGSLNPSAISTVSLKNAFESADSSKCDDYFSAVKNFLDKQKGITDKNDTRNNKLVEKTLVPQNISLLSVDQTKNNQDKSQEPSEISQKIVANNRANIKKAMSKQNQKKKVKTKVKQKTKNSLTKKMDIVKSRADNQVKSDKAINNKSKDAR